jgi:hypothetical protein
MGPTALLPSEGSARYGFLSPIKIHRPRQGRKPQPWVQRQARTESGQNSFIVTIQIHNSYLPCRIDQNFWRKVAIIGYTQNFSSCFLCTTYVKRMHRAVTMLCLSSTYLIFRTARLIFRNYIRNWCHTVTHQPCVLKFATTTNNSMAEAWS